jgi:hypothetical protein
MKKSSVVFVLIIFFVSCKKQSGKHCPPITITNTGHLVDLAPISSVKEIMDTLAKYPQLQAYSVYFDWTHDPGSYAASVRCNVYHKGLVIFDLYYYLFSYTGKINPGLSTRSLPTDIDISLTPSISLERANSIAEKVVHFEHCTLSRLGLSNKGIDSIPDYRLVWRINAVESGYPVVELSAQTGEVYFSDDGISFN